MRINTINNIKNNNQTFKAKTSENKKGDNSTHNNSVLKTVITGAMLIGETMELFCVENEHGTPEEIANEKKWKLAMIAITLPFFLYFLYKTYKKRSADNDTKKLNVTA